MDVKAKGEALLTVLANRRIPLTTNRLTVEYHPRLKHIYHARRMSDGQVKLEVSFFPGFKGWEEYFTHALAACNQLLSGRSEARAIQLPKDEEVS